MKIGFVGLGSMGKGMVRSLLRGGHEVIVWGRSPEPLAEMKAAGAIVADRVDATLQGDALISMLPDDAAVRQVVITNDLFPKNGSSTIHINMATISAAFADELVAFHRTTGVPYLSAPVFGRSHV